MSPEAASAGEPVLGVVNDFYVANPFLGFDPGKYEVRDDLVERASWYAKRVDAEIPFDASVVDVGCGTGQFACFLALKRRRVLGIEDSQHSLDLARLLAERLALKTVDFRRLNLLNWDLPENAFDFVFCNGVMRHTSDPYGGFRNLVRITKPGGRLIVGLYNRYGRLMLLARRRLVSLLSRFDPGAKDRAIQKQLVTLDDDESTHTVAEVLGWFRENGIRYVSSFPKIELFDPGSKRIFRPRSVAGWRDGPTAHLLVQLSWVLTQNAGGGYFVLVGQKQP